MAGQPRKRAMIAELTRRAAEELEDGTRTLDYVVQWVEGGRTLLELANALTEAVGVDIPAQAITRYLNDAFPDEAGPAMTKARQQGAHGMVDRGIDIIDNAPTFDREQLTKAKMRADARFWVAERWNRNDLGKAPEVQVNVNMNTLHLDAMRVKIVPRTSETERVAESRARAFISPIEGAEQLSTIDGTIEDLTPEAITLPSMELA